jgi:hypothetical protein
VPRAAQIGCPRARVGDGLRPPTNPHTGYEPPGVEVVAVAQSASTPGLRLLWGSSRARR